MKSHIFYLIPSKFLSLLAHLTMLIIALHSKDALIQGSIHPDEQDEEEYSKLNTSFMVGLILGICMVTIELTIFLSGLTFFMLFLSTFGILYATTAAHIKSNRSVQSNSPLLNRNLNFTPETIFHIGGTITLAMCVLETWHIDAFWWIFWIGSVLPFSLDIIASIKHIIRNI